ncbi:MAG: inositol monophosphatase family protein [Chloroflexi bacterium]|nr:inositol monophosphatase family protein [Chloroflexota bacterium]
MAEASLNTFLEFALEAAWEAGRITLGYFQTGMQVERKSDNTPLTLADQLAEQKLREMITRYWPDHGIVGEEYGRTEPNSRYTWTLDPIDGTKSFVCGVPTYANLLALLDGEQPVLGIINLPAINEMIYAARGEGCYWNGRRCHVSQVDQLKEAVVLTSGLNYFGVKQAAWDRLVNHTCIQRTWGDAYGYALVATGRADIMVDPAMYLWDAAPLPPIMEEAGGTLTDWQGNATIYSYETIGTNGLLFDQVMALTKPVAEH